MITHDITAIYKFSDALKRYMHVLKVPLSEPQRSIPIHNQSTLAR